MNKLLLLASSLVLINTLQAYEIKFTKKFSKDLVSDTIISNIKIRIQGPNEEIVSSKLELFNKEIKKNNQVEKRLGNYRVYPEIDYSSKKARRTIGYNGELSYQINSDSPKKITRFIQSINSLKNDTNVSVIIGNLSWSIKDKTRTMALDRLRLTAIRWVEVYALNLSTRLDKACIVKNINISSSARDRNYNMPMAQSLSSMTSSVPIPETSNQKIFINPNYTMECK